jgi:hypothetical protein
MRLYWLIVEKASMPAKSRRKQKSLWNIELLPHAFERTVDIPFQACVNRLRDLEEPWRSRSGHPSYKAYPRGSAYDSYHFEIVIRGYSFRNYPYGETGFTRLVCVGTVFDDKSSGKSVVRGQFTLVLRTSMFLSIALPLALILMTIRLNIVAEIFALVASLPIVVIVLLDYVNFQESVYAALRSATAEGSVDK